MLTLNFRRKIHDGSSLHSVTKLDIEDIISLLKLVLSNNYFVYNDTIYKQIPGCAMGSYSPVSPVVANLCMEEIEKTAINAIPVSPKFWKRYVDDSRCIIKSVVVASFHDSWTLSISIVLSPSNTSPTANYLFLTPSSRAITENSRLTCTANPHIQIDILTSIHTMTENIKSAPLRHSCIELWISPTHKPETAVKLLVSAPLYTPTAIP